MAGCRRLLRRGSCLVVGERCRLSCLGLNLPGTEVHGGICGLVPQESAS